MQIVYDEAQKKDALAIKKHEKHNNRNDNGDDDDENVNDGDGVGDNKTKKFEPYDIFLKTKNEKSKNIDGNDKRKRKQKGGLHKHIMEDWDDLAAEEMAYKKYKRGLISKEVYDNCLISEKRLAIDNITGQPILEKIVVNCSNNVSNDNADNDSDEDNKNEGKNDMMFKFKDITSSDESDNDNDSGLNNSRGKCRHVSTKANGKSSSFRNKKNGFKAGVKQQKPFVKRTYIRK